MAGPAPRDTLDVTSETPSAATSERLVSENFLTAILDRDTSQETVRQGVVRRGTPQETSDQETAQVVTRFPPEPNGYAHIGHAIASYLNFGLAQDYGGLTRLRLDDTNPLTERLEYAEGLIYDVRWLGWQWAGEVSYASNYFADFYRLAQKLVRAGKAYVDSVAEDEMSRLRGTATTPGTPSPYRDRSVAENLELLERMRVGEFDNGAHVLRAKIDLINPNMKLRDPVLYRIINAAHYRTGVAWHIYPSYDFAQALSDALDGVTHSLCTLEFSDNRAVYDWLLDTLWEGPRPRQYEFGRRSLEYTVVSKRKLIELVNMGAVSGWDDPRMPTLAGLRRRGVRSEAVRDFAGRVGISRTNRTVDIALLEYAIRSDLSPISPRVMAVLEPLKVTLTNYPGGQTERLEAPYWPHDVPQEGSRALPFGRELYLEQSDFQEIPEPGFKRFSPGAKVRLRHAYVIRCDDVIKNAAGEVTELRCVFEADTLGKNPRKDVRGVVHWVAAEGAVAAEFRLYDRLFKVPNPEEDEVPFTDKLNPDSLRINQGFVEPSVQHDPPDMHYQFERQGYFIRDPDTSPGALVFNRTITLKDTWAKTHDAQAHTRSQSRLEARGQTKAATKPYQEISRDPAAHFSAAEQERHTAFVAQGASPEEAAVLVRDDALGEYFKNAARIRTSPQLASWVVGDVAHERKVDGAFGVAPEQLAELLALTDDGTLSTRLAKEVFGEMVKTGQGAREIVAAQGLGQVSDRNALRSLADVLIVQNPDKAAAYRNGKTGLLGFFVGQLMRETKGQANPQLAQELLKERLEAGGQP